MIKVSYKTTGGDLKKPETTLIRIAEGRYFANYNTPGKAETTVKQMRADGRTGILYSRGLLIQNFPGKTEEEILEIVKLDIKNGIKVAEKKTGKKFKIIDMEIENAK